MEEAVRQKNKFMSVIRRVKPELVEIVDVDDIVEQGILYEADKVPAVVDKLKKAGIDALFLPFCDFGEEQAAAAVAAAGLRSRPKSRLQMYRWTTGSITQLSMW